MTTKTTFGAWGRRSGRRAWRLGAAALFAGSLTVQAHASSEVPPDKVVITEDRQVVASLTGASGDAASGRGWFQDRKLGNCLACHQNDDLADQPFHGEVGPELNGVSDRYSEPELRAILVNSKQVFGDESIMPSFYRANNGARTAEAFLGKTILSAQQVEDVLAYLLTLKEK